MAVILLHYETVTPPPPPPPTPPLPAAIHAKLLVPTGTAGQWYKWTDNSIPTSTSDVQAYVNAAELQYRQDALAAGAPILNQTQMEVQVDLWRHWTYRAVFDEAQFRLRNAMYNAVTPPTVITVNTYKAILDDVETYLNTELGSTIFDRSYKNDRFPVVGTIDASTFTTMTQCVNCHVVLRSWLTERAVVVERIQSTGVLNQ